MTAPPAEHAHHCWHWLVQDAGSPFPGPAAIEFVNGGWFWGIDVYPPDEMHETGWRYLAPAIPPELER